MRNFFEELKRRHVTRVAWIYVVAAWVLIQVVTTLTQALDLAPDLPRTVVYGALAFFPIALLLAWAFDLTAEGVERTDTDATARSLVRARWLRPAIVVGLIVIVAGGLLAWWLRLQQRKEGVAATPIAVFPFSVQGGRSQAYLRDGMVSLLSTTLNGAGELRAIDPALLLKALGPKPPDDIDASRARAIAKRVGAKLYILGVVTATPDGSLNLAAELHDVRGKDESAKSANVTGQPKDVLSLVDQLTQALLSERFRDPASRLQRVASLTTSSLPALKDYLAGEEEYRNSRWPTAIDYFKRALTADSTYALAAYRLATAAEWAADFPTARPATELALRHRERLTNRDRAFLEGFAAWQNGDADAAEPIYRKLVQQYPEDAEAWYRLGEIQFHYNPVRGRPADSARVAFQKAIALNPNLELLRFHLMELALSHRQWATFDSLARTVNLSGEAALRRTAPRVFASNDARQIAALMTQLESAADGTVFAVAAGTAQYTHDFDHAEQVATMLTEPARMWVSQGVGHLFLAELAAGRGRWRAAQEHLNALKNIGPCGKGKAPKWDRVCDANALEYGALYALSPLLRVSGADLRNLRGQVENWQADSVPPFRMPPEYLGAHDGVHTLLRAYLSGLISGRLKEAAQADASARMLAQSSASDSMKLRGLPQRLAAGVRGEAAYERGDVDAALRELTFPVTADLDYMLASPFFSQAYERLVHGLALHAKKQYAQAEPWFDSLLQSRADLFLAGPALFYKAAAAEQAGAKRAAADAYAEFARLWTGCDPALAGPLAIAQRKVRELRQ